MYPAPFYSSNLTLPIQALLGPVPGRLAGAGNTRFSQAVVVVGWEPLHGFELLPVHEVPEGFVSSGLHNILRQSARAMQHMNRC